MTLSLRNRLRILVYFGAAVLFVVGLFDQGPEIAGITVGRLAIIEVVLLGLITAFDRRLWRFRPLVWALKSGPVLRGTWRATITTRDTKQTYEGYLLIRQTYSQIETRLMTSQSTSDSKSCQLTAGPEGMAIVDFVYENIPRPTVRDESPIHFGAARLECVGAWPDRVEGAYWTDRRSSGELVLSGRKRMMAQTYEDARRLFDAEDIDAGSGS